MDIFEKLKAGFFCTSAVQTQELAREFGSHLPPNQILKLSGTLGTGKTTFVQGLASAWGIEDSVKSPSFNLYSIYRGLRQLIHLDAYRLDDATQAEDLLIEEFLKPPFCLVIEWPEKVKGWMEEDAWMISFAIKSPGNHRLQLLSWPLDI